MSVFRRPMSLCSILKVAGKCTKSRSVHRWVAPVRINMYARKKQMDAVHETPRNAHIEWNYDSELYAFSHRLGENFDSDSLKRALVDTSFVVQQEEERRNVGLDADLELRDNSEMSAKGDELMKAYIDQYLTVTLNKVPRKYIRNITSFLTSDTLLGNIGKNLGMSDLIMSSEYPVDEEGLARSVRSVVQALAESSGQDRACSFIRDLIIAQLVGQDLTNLCTPDDPMKELTEYLERNGRTPPEPRLISVVGRHSVLASYDVGMYSDKIMIGRGFGESAEIAQNMAACDALWRVWDVGTRRKPLPFKLELPPLEKFIASTPQ